MPTSFPDDFLWGTATAAHQVEGGNWNNDWWAWEHAPNTTCVEPSGDACDHFTRYAEDLDLLAGLGFGAYRFSLEWSRIEPEEGEWSRAALDHYRRVLDACHDRGVLPMVTLHHFTNPRWVADAGGWSEPATAERFARYCEQVATHLGDRIGMACTINEPNVFSVMGWLMGFMPPARTLDQDGYRRAVETLVAGHRRAVDALKSGPGDFPVGLALAMSDWHAVDGGEERLVQDRADFEDVYLAATDGDDFLGVQAYSRSRIGPDGMVGPEPGVDVLPMGYEFWPNAANAAVRRAAEMTDLPIYITENGIGTDDDEQRIRFLRGSLDGVASAIAEGVGVRGWFHWSLLDNFEWIFGYGIHFGLIAVNRETQERTPKPSAHWLSEVIRSHA